MSAVFPKAKHSPWPHKLLFGSLLLALCGLLLWPMSAVLLAGFRDAEGELSLRPLLVALDDVALSTGLLRSLGVCLGATSLAIAIALPLSWLEAMYEFPWRRTLFRLLLLPLIVPSFVGAIGLRLLLARFGPLSELLAPGSAVGVDWIGAHPLLGVVIVQGLSLYPLLLLTVRAAFHRLDIRQLQAARNLGVGGWLTFRKVLIPQLKSGLLAGTSLVAISSFTDLGTPLVFHAYDLTPVQVFVYLAEPDNPIPYALVCVMLACSSLLYLAGHWGLGKTVTVAAKLVVTPTRKLLFGMSARMATVATASVVACSALPTLCVVWGSISRVGSWYRSVFPAQLTLEHYRTVFADDMVSLHVADAGVRLGALGNSIAYATLASCVATALAVGISLVVARSSLRGRVALDVLAMLPMAVPGLVLAFGYLAVSVQLTRDWGEGAPRWVDVREAPAVFLILAYATRRLPYAVRCVSAGFEMVPVELEQVARNLGASAWITLRRVTLPLIASSVWAGASIAFFLSVLEVSDSLILAQSEPYYPVARAIWEVSQRLGDGLHVACALAVWAMAVLACLAGLAPLSLARVFVGRGRPNTDAP